ncbi:MAG: hypothetical protein V1775_03700 [Bacteroidota bacterium]
MKTKSYYLSGFAITAITAITFLLSGCDEDQSVEPDDSRLYKFTVTRSSSVLANASVSIQTSYQYYHGVTDNQGKCQIKIPNEVTLPTYVIVTVDHNSIMPYALSVPGSDNSNSNKSVNCQNAPSTVLLKEVNLHHLGNDDYGGAPNSQHQLSSEGIEKSFSFYLSSIPGTMPRIQLFARGIEHPTEIKFNGITTDKLENSASNGDLSRYDGQLTANTHTVLHAGNNTITIKTGPNNSSDPWDDIEFCGLLLYYQ